MTRWQRLALGLGLAATALILHVSLCDWSPRRSAGVTITQSGRITDRVPLLAGITNRYGVEPYIASVCGLAVPSLLLTASVVVVLGWRRSERLERGLCLRCGYDIRFKYDDGCSECGWRKG